MVFDMVSREAIEAIKQLLRQSQRSGRLAKDRAWRRKRRSELRPLLSGGRLTQSRDGQPLAGLREVLRNPGGPSDSSRIIGRVRSSPAKIKKWCEQLLDSTADPGERLAITQDGRSIPHLGRNAFSVLLHLKEPDRFGFLNEPVETALRDLGEWPRFPRGSGPGDKYLQVNAILNELAERVGLNRFKNEKLAILDQLLWYFQDTEQRITAVKRKGRLPPGDPDKDAELAAIEGGKRELGPHLKTERSSKLVAGLKSRRGQEYPNLECEICGFSFLLAYGETGQGFIEAHHQELLSKRGRRRSTKGDFDFVCSNCHRMLHRMDPREMNKVRLREIVADNRLEARTANDRWWRQPARPHR